MWLVNECREPNTFDVFVGICAICTWKAVDPVLGGVGQNFLDSDGPATF